MMFFSLLYLGIYCNFFGMKSPGTAFHQHRREDERSLMLSCTSSHSSLHPSLIQLASKEARKSIIVYRCNKIKRNETKIDKILPHNELEVSKVCIVP